MKFGVIDIGSNSVRLMLWADGKTLYKTKRTTRLGEGISFSPYLKAEACERTAAAVSDFVSKAKEDGAEKVFAFATAAVRSAKNPELFLSLCKSLCGVKVEVLDGETEAETGIYGALGGGDGGIIDVGGASTEVALKRQGRLVYSKSVNLGTVRILDGAGRDLDKITGFISEKIKNFGEHDFSADGFYAVGGTATRLAAIKRGIKEYRAQALDGTPLTVDEIFGYAKTLTSLSVEEIRETTICNRSADLIGGGAQLMAMVMDRLNISKVTVSDGDNLEGYLLMKMNGGIV